MGFYGGTSGKEVSADPFKKSFDDRFFVWGWAQLEADFLREYRIDISDMELDWWRFINLVQGLSSQSAFFRFVENNKDSAATYY